MSPTPRVRIATIAAGAILMVASALVGLAGTWLITNTWPQAQPEGLRWLAVLFAPITAATILLAGALWTRSAGATARESIGALLIVEVIALSVVVFYAGELFTLLVFLFWVVVNIIFTPWWLLGFWIGLTLRRRRYA